MSFRGRHPYMCVPIVEHAGAVSWAARRLIVASERTFEGADFIQGVGADTMGLGVIGVEPNCPIERGDRAVEVAAAVQGDSLLSVEFGDV